MPEPVLELAGVEKSFDDGGRRLHVLRGVDLEVGRGSSVALSGMSGSGKSTLLQIAAGLDRPDAGRVAIAGHELGALDDRDLSGLRRTVIGFVFQDFNLLPGLTAEDNLKFQRRLAAMPDDDAWVEELVDSLSLGPLLGRHAEKLSGGEQQRVAIARALAHRPAMVFADEPTGNLPDEMSDEVMQLFRDLVSRSGSGLLLVTHSRALAAGADRQFTLEGGKLRAEACRTDSP